MYSPKISEDIVRTLYILAQQEKRPMTLLVDDLLREKLSELEDTDDDPTTEDSVDESDSTN